jgi:hypothetical protein
MSARTEIPSMFTPTQGTVGSNDVLVDAHIDKGDIASVVLLNQNDAKCSWVLHASLSTASRVSLLLHFTAAPDTERCITLFNTITTR